MNSQPQFTDSKGRPFKPVIRSNQWTARRYVIAGMMIILVPLVTFGAVTKVLLTGGAQVTGILPAVNGGLGADASGYTGLIREASGTPSASELSGDCATSGSNVVTCTKVNGNSVPASAANNQILIGTAANTLSLETIPDCPSGALQYTQATHTWACGTILSGTFADAEVPSGTIDGSNTAFTLAHTPNPAGDLNCFENGVQQRAGGADYTLATATITYGVAPPTGSTLICFYRY